MKEKEFNLSEERKRIIQLLLDRINTLKAEDQFVILDWLNQFCGEIEEQEKEFIKRLKEQLINYEAYDEFTLGHNSANENLKELIDKLAGDKFKEMGE